MEGYLYKEEILYLKDCNFGRHLICLSLIAETSDKCCKNVENLDYIPHHYIGLITGTNRCQNRLKNVSKVYQQVINPYTFIFKLYSNEGGLIHLWGI